MQSQHPRTAKLRFIFKYHLSNFQFSAFFWPELMMKKEGCHVNKNYWISSDFRGVLFILFLINM